MVLVGEICRRILGDGSMKMLSFLFLFACVAACDVPEVVDQQPELSAQSRCDYPQLFGNGSHTGRACPATSKLAVVIRITQDPDADAENAASGFLQLHEAPPLTAGDFVVVPTKSGFTGQADRSTEHYGVSVYKWQPSVTTPGAILSPIWTTTTAWQPVDGIVGSLGSYTNGYVQQFAPAIAGGTLLVPGRAGTLTRYSLQTGSVASVIDPFVGTAFDGDDLTIEVGGISVDSTGVAFYTVTSFPLNHNRSSQPRASFLVRVAPDDVVQVAEWSTIARADLGIPGLHDPCEYPFGTGGTAGATSSASKAPIFGCGVQRPAFNAPVAIANDDSTLIVYSYANNAQGAAFLIAVDAATLHAMRASDTRGHLLHGCGVRLADNSKGNGISGTSCATITDHGSTHFGFDPDFNGPVRFIGPDLIDSAPTIAPNGDIAIGSYDGGFQFGGDYDARGAGMTFHADGTFAAVNQDFWWEVTPSVIVHTDGTFSYLQDRQAFSPLGSLAVAQYTQAYDVEGLSELPLADKQDHAEFEFMDAHIVFDADGSRYGLSSDGHVYKFDASGHILESVPLLGADGALRQMATLSSYWARDQAGHIYVSYAGSVYIIASSSSYAQVASSATVVGDVALQAKASALRTVRPVGPPID